MGKVSQHYMEEIEAKHEFECLKNPQFSNEPEPAYEMELVECAESILKSAKELLFQRDLVTQYDIAAQLRHQADHLRFLAGTHYGRLSDQRDVEREKEEEAEREYRSMQDVYAEVRSDFI